MCKSLSSPQNNHFADSSRWLIVKLSHSPAFFYTNVQEADGNFLTIWIVMPRESAKWLLCRDDSDMPKMFIHLPDKKLGTAEVFRHIRK